MDSPPKIRENPRNPWLKVKKSAVKNNEICANLRNLRIKSVKSVNFFMQNEPNFKKAEIALIHYMTNGYAKICSLVQPKNEAKTKPNEPKSNPIQTQFKPKQTQFIVSLSNLCCVCNSSPANPSKNQKSPIDSFLRSEFLTIQQNRNTLSANSNKNKRKLKWIGTSM